MEEQAIHSGQTPKFRVNRLMGSDVTAAFRDGWRDFRRYPAIGLFSGPSMHWAASSLPSFLSTIIFPG